MQAYREGRGSITVRSRTDVETSKKGDRQSIVVTEIPYQVNKKRLIENIADLVRDKVIEGISDLRDESDRDGMRIVIELKRGEVPEVILNNLYKHTQLQTTFGIIMLAIARGRPKVLNLLEFIEEFIEFRREVVRRRTEFELRKAEARAHILEGLRIALDHLDQVIAIIRASKTTAEARDGLMTSLSLSQLQAQAILEMQLQRLTGLERQKIVDELAELMKLIEQLRAILASDILLMQVVVDELKAVREKYGDAAAHGHRRRRRRVPRRGPDCRRRRRHHRERDRVHQAHGDHGIPQPAPRRPRPHRHADPRGRHRQPPVCGLDAQLHPHLLRQGPLLLAEGARDSGRRRGRQGQGHRQPGLDAARREDRVGARLRASSTRRTGSS